ncbi:19121_t:CDS:2 [Funneliformis geosporum]|nr:19121_t:CDS:2 [Funneliformis geosporum]
MDQPKSSQNLIDRKDDVDEVKTIITPLSKYNFYKDMMWINQSENPGALPLTDLFSSGRSSWSQAIGIFVISDESIDYFNKLEIPLERSGEIL